MKVGAISKSLDASGDLRPLKRAVSKTRKRGVAGRPTSEELERRKSKVMQVATALFVREGYSATTIVDIAKHSGVATRTVYQHFGDKEDLFRSVMFARETAAVFAAPEIDANEPLIKNMMLVADYIHNVTFRPTTIDMMRLAIAESKRFPDMMRALIVESHARFNANVKKIFDKLVESGLIKDNDTSSSAEMFIHLVLGDTPLLVFGGWKPVEPPVEQLDQKVRLFVTGRWGATAHDKRHEIKVAAGLEKTPRKRLSAGVSR